jgi:hypothetical protein
MNTAVFSHMWNPDFFFLKRAFGLFGRGLFGKEKQQEMVKWIDCD